MPQPIQDVLCMAIPAEIDVEVHIGHPDEEIRTAFFEKLTEMAHKAVWDQWPTRRPKGFEWTSIDWLITDDLADVAAFQPAHDCADCWMGNLKAEEFLRANPGRYIAMGNLTYTPIWS